MAFIFFKLFATFVLFAAFLAGIGAFMNENFNNEFTKDRAILRGNSIAEVIATTMIISGALGVVCIFVAALTFIWV